MLNTEDALADQASRSLRAQLIRIGARKAMSYAAAALFGMVLFPYVYAFDVVRDWHDPNSRYKGTYLQVIGDEANRRYSVFTITHSDRFDYFNPRYTYFLKGEQFDGTGARKYLFDSDDVTFRSGLREYISFYWTARAVDATEREASGRATSHGFTKMDILPHARSDSVEGEGFVVTVDQENHVSVKIAFFKVDAYWIEHIETITGERFTAPVTKAEKRDFVRQIHQAFVAFPDLLPFLPEGNW